MPDLEGMFPLILIIVFLWLRSIGQAMKRNRQQQEQAMAQVEEGSVAFSDMPEPQPELRPDAPSPTEVAAPPRTKRPSLREQLLEMGRQLEEQMQQAAEEGRPGSLVGHVEPGEAPEMPGMLRPSRSVSRSSAPVPPAPPPAAPAPPVRAAPRRPLSAPATPSTGLARSGRQGEQPLERLERYPPLARAVILSEIIGPPPGLSRDREE